MARKRQNSSIALPHGRKRTVSPNFFQDPDLLSLLPIERLFYEGLWCYADREGRLLDKPIDLKIKIVPMDQLDPAATLESFARLGLICRYEAAGLRFLALKQRTWKEVQRLHPDEPDSAIPPPTIEDWAARGGIPVHGNRVHSPVIVHENSFRGVSVHGNTAVDPISGPGSSCLRDPRAFGILVPSDRQLVSDTKPKRPKKPQQAELPTIPPKPPPPPRIPSAQEELYEDYQLTRRVTLEDLGLPNTPDEPPNIGYVNLVLGPISKAVEPLKRGTRTGWERLTELWFEQPWAASMNPPFPFRAFSSEKVQFGDPAKPDRPGLIQRLVNE